MKTNPSLIGLIQALGVAAYCGLVSGLLILLEKINISPPHFLGVILVLFLLVFSAAVTGSIVFGYAAYLALNQRIKEALSVVLYTLLYCLGIGIIGLVLITALT